MEGNRVLFICTGNYYRSRFAEALFNHHALRRRLGWSAFSRGLAVQPQPHELSPLSRRALDDLGVDAGKHTPSPPTSLSRTDLEASRVVVALKEAEHRYRMGEQFPDWESRIHYWNVHDLDAAGPETTLPEIERRVLRMLHNIGRGKPALGHAN